MAERALERSIALDALAISRRSDAMVTNQPVSEPHVLLRHVAVETARAGRAGGMMRVCARALGPRKLAMALRAKRVAGLTVERRKLGSRVLGMRIMAARAGKPAR